MLIFQIQFIIIWNISDFSFILTILSWTPSSSTLLLFDLEYDVGLYHGFDNHMSPSSMNLIYLEYKHFSI